MSLQRAHQYWSGEGERLDKTVDNPVRILRADPARLFARHRTHQIDAAIARVFLSGRFILGEEVAAFEAEFARYLGVGHVVGVASGTQALTFALSALGIEPGDEVITVSMTFAATAIAIESVGAKPIFVDIDADTRCMDPNALEAAIGPATAAICPYICMGYRRLWQRSTPSRGGTASRSWRIAHNRMAPRSVTGERVT